MMTFKEAKDVFLNHGWIKVEGGTYFDGSKWREAVRILSDYLQREPCEDCISRQAVLDTISELNAVSFYEAQEDSKECYYEIQEMIKNIPSVILQPKMGYWIDADGDNAICACCNRLNHLYGEYCKHCGAKMQEVEE